MKNKTLALTIVSSCALIFSSCGAKPAVKKYNIIFQNDDGTVLQESKVKKGDTPVYEGDNPTKASTAEYSYTWNGWDPEIAPASQDQTYTATYQSTKRSYTIRFVNEDGTELDSQVLEYGATPVYAGQTPEKAATAQYSYTFGGWSPAISSVVGDATYTATYQEVLRSYSITFKNGDGSNLEVKDVAYGQVPATALTPTKESTVDKDFTFDHWDPEPAAVTGEATYTPVFNETARKYTITFQYDDGTVIESVDVAYGTVPQCSFTPEKESTAQYSYAFSGWDPTPVAVTGEATYTAQFVPSVRSYTVKFLNGDGSVLQQDTLEYGELPECTSTPTKAAEDHYYYEFTGWDPEVTNVTGEATYTPKFEKYITPLDVNEAYDFTSFKYGAAEFSGTDDRSWGMPAAEAHVMKYKVWNQDTFELRLPVIDFSQHNDVSMTFEGTNYHGRVTLGLDANDVTHKDGVESNRDIVGTLMFSYDNGKLYEALVFGTITINNVITDQDIIHGRKSVSIYVGALYDRFFNVYDITFGTENFKAPEYDLTANYAGAYEFKGTSDFTWTMGSSREKGGVTYTSNADHLMYYLNETADFRLGLPKLNFVMFKCLSMDLFAPGWNSGAKVGLKSDDVNYSTGSGDSDPRGNLTIVYTGGKLIADLYFGDAHVTADITDEDVILGNKNPEIFAKAYYDRLIIASNIKANPTMKVALNHDWSLSKMGAALANSGGDVTWGMNQYTTADVLGYRVWDLDTFILSMPKINYSVYKDVTFDFESTVWHKNVKFGLASDDVNYSTSQGDDGSGDIASLTGSLKVVNNGDSLAATLTLGDTAVTVNITDANVINGTNSLNVYVTAVYNRNLLLNHIYLQF